MLPDGHRVVITALGDAPLDALDADAALVAQPAPDPAALGPGDVIVAIRSAAVGWVDLLMTSGQYQHVPTPPYTPGLEYAGTVAWAGPDAGFAIGEPVLVDGFLAGPRSSGAYRAYGGFASYGVAPREAVHRVPGALTLDQACNLLGNYETAYHCLIARGRLAAGETVLIHGASGSTGLAAVQVAKLVGARVIATGRSDAKLATVAAHGADHVINTGAGPLRDQVKAIAPAGVDVVYDGVGGELSIESLRCVRFGARYLIVGWAATPLVARGRGQRGAPNANVLPTNLLMMKGLDVLGCPTVISTAHDPALRPPRLAQILAWAAAGQIGPHVSHTFPLAEFRAAMRAKWTGAVTGGCVVRPALDQ
jgi:NADPH2:quinone reductase